MGLDKLIDQRQAIATLIEMQMNGRDASIGDAMLDVVEDLDVVETLPRMRIVVSIHVTILLDVRGPRGL
jgi:hypothetical protein